MASSISKYISRCLWPRSLLLKVSKQAGQFGFIMDWAVIIYQSLSVSIELQGRSSKVHWNFSPTLYYPHTSRYLVPSSSAFCAQRYRRDASVVLALNSEWFCHKPRPHLVNTAPVFPRHLTIPRRFNARQFFWTKKFSNSFGRPCNVAIVSETG